MILIERYGAEAVPSVRTLQYAFRKAGLNKRRSIRTVSEKKVTKVHEEWQIDAKENLELQDGSRACYLTIVDTKSGGVLGNHCFAKKNISQVTEIAVRDALISSFQKWGKPKAI
ncbi:MAG: hypothetical protein MK212_12805 [Saprospiraceae bacterium]|nr:hypothetical protein [Saprospiraceae bacterium]